MSKIDHVKAAGVLPYTFITTPSGRKKLYFLIGTDKSNKVSDFGGKMEKGEDIFDTAAREYYEESSGLLGSLSKIKKEMKSDAMRTTFVICKCYKIYLLKIDYVAELPKIYDAAKKNSVGTTYPAGFFEMGTIKWMSATQLLKIMFDKKRIAFRLMAVLRVLKHKYGSKLDKLK